jgi:polyisoprenoid-binding protein YceI
MQSAPPEHPDLAGRWTLDAERTSVKFSTRAKWFLTVRGTARAVAGHARVFEEGGFTGRLVIDAASIDTRNRRRDQQLRTADYLEVETYPTIDYEAEGGHMSPDGRAHVIGALTLHGRREPLHLDAAVDVDGDEATVSTEVGLDRARWGLTRLRRGTSLRNRVSVRAVFTKD